MYLSPSAMMEVNGVRSKPFILPRSIFAFADTVHSCFGALAAQAKDECDPTWNYPPSFERLGQVFCLCRLRYGFHEKQC